MSYQLNKQTVFQGRAAEFPVCFVDSAGTPFFCCGITGSKIMLENQDGTMLEKTPTRGITWGIGDQTTYMHFVSLTKEESALLKLGGDQSIFLEIIFGDNSSKYEMKRFLTVQADPF